MKFAHLGDCHLGSWRHPELKELNLKSFQYAVSYCIKEKVDFVLIAGDLFDSSYPPIDTLRDTFFEFRRLKDAGIPIFIIPGSHDYSVSGKTFLDVLEKAGLCKNLSSFTERDGKIILSPTICSNVAIYGYGGKKSGLEVHDISRMKLDDSPGLFKILMLHTAIRDAVGDLPIDAVDEKLLPKVDYLALGHLHINYNKNNRVYSGPIFPNNLSELEELKCGSFYIFESGKIYRHEIRLKDVSVFEINVTNALSAAEDIISRLSASNLSDKIVILKLFGVLEKGKLSDIDFKRVESEARKNGAYAFLKSTTKLLLYQPELKADNLDASQLESQIVRNYEEKNPGRFNIFIKSLSQALQAEKLEDEKSAIFEERLVSEAKKALNL
jgi:DNA repair exonuclease SbcCD nuclease subunit